MQNFHEDPNADARSLMMRAPCICDGEAKGIPCRHYWSVIQKFRAQNADTLRSGEKQRACTLTSGLVLEFTTEEKPTYCNNYDPRKTNGLVSIVKRTARAAVGLSPKAGWGYAKVDDDFVKYNPMTIEEIEELRKKYPDQDIPGMRGKNPLSMSAHDIATGPQIGILQPGEKMPTLGLSEDTEKELGGIFDSNKSIFKDGFKDGSKDGENQ